MKTNWQIKKLGEVCDILDNLRKPVTARDRKAGDFPYYGATGIQDYVDSYIFDESLVLVGEDGARWDAGDNTAFAISGKTWVNNHAHVIRPHRDILLDQWLIYFLNISDLSEYITGTTVKKLNQEKLRSIPIPLPPLATQRQIVTILDEKFAKLREAKRLREEATLDTEKILSATLREIFEEGKEKGWEEKLIKDICEHPQYGFTASSTQDPVGPKMLRITDIQEGKVNWDTVPYCYCEDVEKYQLKKNDLVFARTGATVGKSFLITEDPENAVYASYLIRLRTKENISSEFLYYFFQSPNYWNQITENAVGGAQPNVNGTKLANLSIFVPPLTEQKQIVTRLDMLSEKLRTLRELQTSQLADLKQLEKAYLREAFRGELC